jgi:glycosyltransferase involved in cell wall biosynthesis
VNFNPYPDHRKGETPMAVRISLVISTLNEEENIGDCIRSATGFAEDVIVVDMSSTDRTAQEATSAGAIVHVIPRVPFVDPTRNYALSLASGEWILLMDADERLTPEVKNELRRIAVEDLADVVEVAFEVYMFGDLIRYSGWQNIRKKSFFKKGFLTYPADEVHAHPTIKGRLLSLPPSKGMMVHYNYKDLRHFVLKMNDYTDGEALKLLRAGGSCSPLRGVYWGLRHFFRRYFLCFGYKDGWLGFILSVFMGFYWFISFAKAWEIKRKASHSHKTNVIQEDK